MDNTNETRDVRQVVLRVAQIAAIALSALVVFLTVNDVSAGHAATAEQHRQNQTEMQRLQDDIDAQGALPDVSDETVSGLMTSARARGREIAEMETVMHTAAESTDDVETIKSRSGYIGERLSDASQTMRATWAAGITDDMVWTFCEPTQFDGETLKCVWLGTSVEDDALLCYVTGIYDQTADVFSGVTSLMTWEGQQRLGFTVDSDGENYEGETEAADDAADGSADAADDVEAEVDTDE